jgi:GMP synthase-like glutamine amidotransferase
MQEVRPDWVFDVYSVKDDKFPSTLDGVDGVLITGSPASVHDGAPWIARLETLIQQIAAQKLPTFGACFGHQAIATALGGRVEYNPQGWVLGSVETQDQISGASRRAYAAHKEQVTELPKGAKITATTQGCPVAGFAIDNHILTTQYHPEMTDGFIAALLDEMAGDTDPEVIARANDSLSAPADRAAWAEQMARFFEGRVTV